MRRLLMVASLVAFGCVAAFAESASIKQRKDIFETWGKAAGPMGKMLRGQEAFDLAKVQDGLKVIQKTAKAPVALFPEDSKTGDKTEALPAIWENKAKFDAMFAKLDADLSAALPLIKDEASFKTEIVKVLGNCRACHDDYRKK